MEKLSTLNNRASRDIINQAINGAYRAVAYLLYNYRDMFEETAYDRILKAVYAIVGNEIYNFPNREDLAYEIRYYFINLLREKGGLLK